MVIDNKFNIGDFVYCVTDSTQSKMQVISLRITKYSIIYICSCGVNQNDFYDYELSLEPDLVFKTNN